MKRFSVALLVIMCFWTWLLVFACRTPPSVVRIKMDYTPTNDVPPPKAFPGTSIFIASFEDQRKILDQIGQNSEKANIVPVKAESAEVVAFVENAFKKEFRRGGLNLVDTESQAKRIMKVSILNVWVEEKDLYDSSIVAQVTVLNNSRSKLFQENYKGVAQRWGSSYQEEEYRKVLSDAIVDLLKKMFNDEAFLKSLT